MAGEASARLVWFASAPGRLRAAWSLVVPGTGEHDWYAVVDALESHNAMADQALRHEKVFKSLAGLLVGEVYRQLRQPPQGWTGAAI